MRDFGDWFKEVTEELSNNIKLQLELQKSNQPNIEAPVLQWKSAIFDRAIEKVKDRFGTSFDKNSRSHHLLILEVYCSSLCDIASIKDFVGWEADGITYIEDSAYKLSLEEFKEKCIKNEEAA